MKHKKSAYLMMASMIAAGVGVRRRRSDLHGIDIRAEYELIQQKRSHLSASMRRKVIEAYEEGES
jgi:hypothetical protein